jgi:hypothetical protein
VLGRCAQDLSRCEPPALAQLNDMLIHAAEARLVTFA